MLKSVLCIHLYVLLTHLITHTVPLLNFTVSRPCEPNFLRSVPSFRSVLNLRLLPPCREREMALPDKILARKLMKKEKKKFKMLQDKAKQEKENGAQGPAKDVSGEELESHFFHYCKCSCREVLQ